MYVFDFFFLPLSCPYKMASTWVCHHHKAANHPACACTFSHVWRAPVRIPMWGRVSLATRLNLASFCCVVSWREAQLSWWPPRWVDGNEESSIKVSRVERFYDSKEECVCVCVCGGGDGGIYFTRNSPHIAKTRNSMWKKRRQQFHGTAGGFQESKIPNTFILPCVN